MSLEALVLGVFSGLRPGTSLAAVLALLEAPDRRRGLLAFTAAGFAAAWLTGIVVVGVFHGANVALGASTLTAVLDVAAGSAALGFAAGLQQGWVQPGRRRAARSPAVPSSSRLARRLRDPSPRVAALAGIVTHLPGLVTLVALNAIAADDPGPVAAAVRVALYDVLWFLVPLSALVLVVVRPEAAAASVAGATAWARRHERAILVWGLAGLGAYLLGKGITSLVG